MKVFVRTLTGKTLMFMVSAVDTVEYLKSRIQDEQGTPHDQCRLYVSGKQMMDEQSLAFYQVMYLMRPSLHNFTNQFAAYSTRDYDDPNFEQAEQSITMSLFRWRFILVV